MLDVFNTNKNQINIRSARQTVEFSRCLYVIEKNIKFTYTKLATRQIPSGKTCIHFKRNFVQNYKEKSWKSAPMISLDLKFVKN